MLAKRATKYSNECYKTLIHNGKKLTYTQNYISQFKATKKRTHTKYARNTKKIHTNIS